MTIRIIERVSFDGGGKLTICQHEDGRTVAVPQWESLEDGAVLRIAAHYFDMVPAAPSKPSRPNLWRAAAWMVWVALGLIVALLLGHVAAHASCQATDCHSDHNTEVCRCL